MRMKRLPLLFGMLLAACVPGSTNHTELSASLLHAATGKASKPAYHYVEPMALIEFSNRLQSEGRNAQQHGVYVEKLNSGEPVAMLNENVAFNPASVIKLATTLAALERLGPDYRFRTEFRAAGEVDRRTGEMQGDLILVSNGNPSLSLPDARLAGDELKIGFQPANTLRKRDC